MSPPGYGVFYCIVYSMMKMNDRRKLQISNCDYKDMAICILYLAPNLLNHKSRIQTPTRFSQLSPFSHHQFTHMPPSLNPHYTPSSPSSQPSNQYSPPPLPPPLPPYPLPLRTKTQSQFPSSSPAQTCSRWQMRTQLQTP